MNSATASGEAFSDSPKVARVKAEERFAKRVRAWIGCDESVVNTARVLGLDRSKLYKTFLPTMHFRAAWLELLAPASLKAALEEMAAGIGYELRPVADVAEDHCDARQLSEVVHELTDVIRAISGSAGRAPTPAEAHTELSEIDEAMQVLVERRARCREVIGALKVVGS